MDLFLYAVYIVGILLFISFIGTAAGKGWIGEIKISSMLKRFAKRDNGYLINNLMIPDEETGRTSQIDHVLFLHSGIYVVESKNYAGRIYGKLNQLEWTQVLKYGKVKNKFYNPIMQNKTHVSRICNILGSNKYIYSEICFLRADLRHVEGENLWYYSLKRKLKKSLNTYVLSDMDLDHYYNILLLYKKSPVKSKRQHIKEIHKLQKDIANNICPRCGGKLILKQGQYGEFYACENFPKCKFKKKA